MHDENRSKIGMNHRLKSGRGALKIWRTLSLFISNQASAFASEILGISFFESSKRESDCVKTAISFECTRLSEISLFHSTAPNHSGNRTNQL